MIDRELTFIVIFCVLFGLVWMAFTAATISDIDARLTTLERQPRYSIGTVYGDLPTTTTALTKGEGETHD